ncbi:MAG: SIS domain-containing protein [Erysipelotrichaceae bacterium]|nr:SIS domain-containing protein [Erysipelotrichaceae bacterium]MBR3694295.1 SIS domain-containing protein [Erysipelotrichales bacterium]
MVSMDMYLEALRVRLEQLYSKENTKIQEAARLCYECIQRGGVIQVFGSGHSIGFGMELIGRVGSLIPIHMIDTSDFVLRGLVSYADYKDPTHIFERREGIAERLFKLYTIHEEDLFIIISNSGINGVVIDMAITATQKGHTLIVITSLEHTLAEDSRHPSGKKLYELADLVIDNCGPMGDALLAIDENTKICSLSSITGAFIAQMITTECVDRFLVNGLEPPILMNEDTLEAMTHNQAILQRYDTRI